MEFIDWSIVKALKHYTFRDPDSHNDPRGPEKNRNTDVNKLLKQGRLATMLLNGKQIIN